MEWRLLVAVVLVTACGAPRGTASAGGGSSALLTGDTCALNADATTCAADPQGCSWYPNTRPCRLGQPCPAGWCNRTRQDGGGAPSGGGSASASCACSSGAGDVCVLQVGGPAVQAGSTQALTCRAVPASCTATDPCSCIAQGTIERCWASAQVTNLCICDNGVR